MVDTRLCASKASWRGLESVGSRFGALSEDCWVCMDRPIWLAVVRAFLCCCPRPSASPRPHASRLISGDDVDKMAPMILLDLPDDLLRSLQTLRCTAQLPKRASFSGGNAAWIAPALPGMRVGIDPTATHGSDLPGDHDCAPSDSSEGTDGAHHTWDESSYPSDNLDSGTSGNRDGSADGPDRE